MNSRWIAFAMVLVCCSVLAPFLQARQADDDNEKCLSDFLGESPAVIIDVSDFHEVKASLRDHALFQHEGWRYGFDLLLNGKSAEGERNHDGQDEKKSVMDYVDRVLELPVGRVTLIVESFEPLEVACLVFIPESDQDALISVCRDVIELTPVRGEVSPEDSDDGDGDIHEIGDGLIHYASSDSWVVFGNGKQIVTRVLDRARGETPVDNPIRQNRSYRTVQKQIESVHPTIEISMDIPQLEGVGALNDLWKKALPLSEIRRLGVSISIVPDSDEEQPLSLAVTSFALMTQPRVGVSRILGDCGELTEFPCCPVDEFVFFGASNIDFNLIKEEIDAAREILGQDTEDVSSLNRRDLIELFGQEYQDYVDNMSRATGASRGVAYWQDEDSRIRSMVVTKLVDQNLHMENQVKLAGMLKAASGGKFGYSRKSSDDNTMLVRDGGTGGMVWFDDWIVQTDSDWLEEVVSVSKSSRFALPRRVDRKLGRIRKQMGHSRKTIAMCATSPKFFEITLDSWLFDTVVRQFRRENRDGMSKEEFRELLKEKTESLHKKSWQDRLKPRSRREEVMVARLALARACVDTFGEMVCLISNEKSGIKLSLVSFAQRDE